MTTTELRIHPTQLVREDLIVLEDVGREYIVGDVTVTALDGIHLHVAEGEFVVVLGPSGSGKTTLINLIGALDTPTSGTITVGDVDVTSASRRQLFAYRRRLVSFIFQSFKIFPGLTAEENVQFGIDASGREPSAPAHAYLEQVGLGDLAASSQADPEVVHPQQLVVVIGADLPPPGVRAEARIGAGPEGDDEGDHHDSGPVPAQIAPGPGEPSCPCVHAAPFTRAARTRPPAPRQAARPRRCGRCSTR
jgi:ABC-type sugar transport system ATPase subunit